MSRVYNGATGEMETTFTANTAAPEAGIPFNLLADGRIDSVGGEPANIQVDDALNLVVAGEFEGTNGGFASLSKTIMVRLPQGGGLADEIEVSSERLDTLPIDVTVNADGSATIIIGSVETGGPTTAEGFFNEDGSIGVFRTRYDEDGDGTGAQPSELGLMILAELP